MREQNIRGKRALELLTRLSFRRPSGTDLEAKAANLLFHEIEALGLHPYFRLWRTCNLSWPKAGKGCRS